jgi:hypothetical protein
MLTNLIIKYVRVAFNEAGDLVKKMTILPMDAGVFNPATGIYDLSVTTEASFVVEALDDIESESIRSESFYDRSSRRYIVLSGKIIKVGYTFIDDGITYTISKVLPVQQNATVFVYNLWAEA